MDRIPLIEPVVGDGELENVEKVLESGWMTEGPFADRLQDRIAEITGADHAITVTSCTTGMDLALDAIGVGDGDEVVLPSFTYPATANVVVRQGADPVLVDVDRHSYNVDPAAIERAITEDTAAIMPVSMFGQPLDADPITEIAEAHDLHVIEDAAWALGSSYGDQSAGSQFDASVFSFHPRKILTTGEGGAVTTDDDTLQREMRTIKNFGMSYYEDSEGFVEPDATNYRLSDILAAVGVAQMEKSDEIYGRRQEVAAQYDRLLADVSGVVPPNVDAAAHHTYGSYCIYVEAGDDSTRDELIDRLDDAGIETQVGTYALHLTDAFSDAKRGTELTTSEDLYHNLLTLPIAHRMGSAEVDRVVDTLDETLADYRDPAAAD